MSTAPTKYLDLHFSDVKQIGSKNLFTATHGKHTVLISYKTIIGIYDSVENIWNITTAKYSLTTSKQITMFRRGNNACFITEAKLQAKLIRCTM